MSPPNCYVKVSPPWRHGRPSRCRVRRWFGQGWSRRWSRGSSRIGRWPPRCASVSGRSSGSRRASRPPGWRPGPPHAGQPSRRRLAPAVRARVADLMRTVYAGFNDCHLTEKLREVEGLTLCRESVRDPPGAGAARQTPPPRASPSAAPAGRGPGRQLAAARRQPRRVARGPRPRHDAAWRARRCHGRRAGAALPPHEDLHGYAMVFDQVFTTWGLPVACYGDGTNILVRTDPHWTLAEELRGAQDPTHLGRVLVDLGIGYIRARSPQAKGRIERLWRTLQDRLVGELRLRGIATREAANAFLPLFIADYNRRFARPPADPTPAWRRPPRDRAARELSLHAHRRPRQHRAPRPALAATAPRPRRPLVCRAPRRAPRGRGRPPGRARGRAGARRAGGARARLRAAARADSGAEQRQRRAPPGPHPRPEAPRALRRRSPP